MEKHDGVRAFRTELKNYRYHQIKVKEFKFKIEDTYGKLGGYHSPSFSSIGRGQMPKDVEYKLRNDIEKFQRIVEREEERVKYIEEILEAMPEEERNAAILIYADGESVIKVADMYHLSDHGIRYRINKAIWRAMKNNGEATSSFSAYTSKDNER